MIKELAVEQLGSTAMVEHMHERKLGQKHLELLHVHQS